MNRYNWRNSTTSIHQKTRAKLAFKTENTDWVNTTQPVVVLVSTQSLFHSPLLGDLKMQSLMSTIKSHVKGPITVLFATHTHTNGPAHDETLALMERYEKYMEGCTVASLNSYTQCDHVVQDSYFSTLIESDVLCSYTPERALQFPDKELYVKQSRLDLIELCAGLQFLANKGYRFLFYPGKASSSIEHFLKKVNLSWVHVFLSIEKKTNLAHTNKL